MSATSRQQPQLLLQACSKTHMQPVLVWLLRLSSDQGWGLLLGLLLSLVLLLLGMQPKARSHLLLVLQTHCMCSSRSSSGWGRQRQTGQQQQLLLQQDTRSSRSLLLLRVAAAASSPVGGRQLVHRLMSVHRAPGLISCL